MQIKRLRSTLLQPANQSANQQLNRKRRSPLNQQPSLG
jgi:hypothetical protein